MYPGVGKPATGALKEFISPRIDSLSLELNSIHLKLLLSCDMQATASGPPNNRLCSGAYQVRLLAHLIRT